MIKRKKERTIKTKDRIKEKGKQDKRKAISHLFTKCSACTLYFLPRKTRIKVETIERKVVVRSAILKHGFVFDFSPAPNGNCESSDEAD